MPTPRKQAPVQTQVVPSRTATQLAILRKTRGLTQAQLAQTVGISRDLMANYESGRTRLTDDIIILLANALKVSSDEILGLSPPSSDEIPSLKIMRRIKNIEKLPPSKQKAILQTIDMALQSIGPDQIDKS